MACAERQRTFACSDDLCARLEDDRAGAIETERILRVAFALDMDLLGLPKLPTVLALRDRSALDSETISLCTAKVPGVGPTLALIAKRGRSVC